MSFKKLLYLPSGGLSYPPFSWVSPLTQDLLLYQSDNNLFDSMFDYYHSIVARHTELPCQSLELYTQDLYYIWLFFLTTDLLRFGGYYTKTICKHCAEINRVRIDIGELDINIVNKFSTPIPKQFTYQIDDYKFILGYRRAKHNIEYSNLILNMEDSDEDITIIALFLSTQMDDVVNTKTHTHLQQHEYFWLLQSLRFHDLLNLFDFVINKENDFSINQNIYFECQKCKKQNVMRLFDNLLLSFMITPDGKGVMGEQEQFFNNAFNMTRAPMMNYEEFLKIPLRYSPAMTNVIAQMDLTAVF